MLRCCVLTLVLASAGCSGEDAGAPLIPDSANIVKRLTLNHEVVMMTKNAPYDTVQLRAVPISLNGDTASFDNPVVYYRQSFRDTAVQVDSFTGMVRSRAATGNGSTNVIARLAIGTDTFYDTVSIMVRNDVSFRRVGRVEIDPAFIGDSAVRWLGIGAYPFSAFTPWVRVYDTANIAIPSTQRLMKIIHQKPELVSGNNQLYPSAALSGEGYIYVRLYAYGQDLRDSVLFRSINPPVRFVVIDRVVPVDGAPRMVSFPSTTYAKVGTTVFFANKFGNTTLHLLDDDFGICAAPSGFCGNRVRYSRDFIGSVLVWTDSVDITFDQPSMALIGDNYGQISLPMINDSIPSGGGSGNIPAFSIMYCKILVQADDFLNPPGNDTCGRGTATDMFTAAYVVFDTGLRGRKFTTPGTYHFASTRHPGVSGTIIVTP